MFINELKEMWKNEKYQSIIILFMIFAWGGLFWHDNNKFLLFYTLILLAGTASVFTKYYKDPGSGTLARIEVRMQLITLVIAASLFFFLKSIVPEVFFIEIDSVRQAYFVYSISGYFLIRVLAGKQGVLGESRANLLHICFGIILIFEPVVYFIYLLF